MGIFDFLSGSDEAQTAAAQNQAALQQYAAQQAALQQAYQTNSLGALGSARTNALSDWEQGLTGQLGAYSSALGTLNNVPTSPLTDAIAAQQAGYGGATAAGQAAVNAYNPLSQLGQGYGGAVDAYYAALGLKGPEAAAAARTNFLPGTGYQYQVDEAMRQALGAASKAGIALSPGTVDALQQRAQGLAGGQWQDYLNRLQGFVSPQLQAAQAAAQGQAAAYGNLGQLGLTGASNLANAYNNLFIGQRGLAGDISGQYANIANAYGTNYGARAGTETGYGSDVANVYGNVLGSGSQTARDVVQGNIASNNAVAQAAAADASNYWNAIGSGVKAAGTALAPGFGAGGKFV